MNINIPTGSPTFDDQIRPLLPKDTTLDLFEVAETDAETAKTINKVYERFIVALEFNYQGKHYECTGMGPDKKTAVEACKKVILQKLEIKRT